MPKGNHRKTRSNKDYVTGHTDAQLERALTNPALDLKPWAWFALGWYSQTLHVWAAFASSFRHNARGSSVFRSDPTSVYYIRHAFAVIEDEIPSGVRERIAEYCQILVLHNDDFARRRNGQASGSEALFETVTTAVAGLQAVVNDLQGSDSANPQWLPFGLKLGVWYLFEQFHDRPLAESTDGIVELCQEMPRSAMTMAPSIVQVATLASKLEVSGEILARELCRLFDASESSVEEIPDENLPVRLHVAVLHFALRVQASLLQKRLTPRWTKVLNRGTLEYRGKHVRTIPNVAKSKNIVLILDSFEEEGWPTCIDTPLKSDSILLHTTLNQLREGLSRSITFRAANVGKGIQWVNLEEPTSMPSPAQ